MKISAKGIAGIEETLADLRKDIDANTESIDQNAESVGENQRTAKQSIAKVNSLNTAVSRELSKLKSDGSSRQQMAHLEI